MQYLEFNSNISLITHADITNILMHGTADLYVTPLTKRMAILNEQASALINHPSFTTMTGVHRTTIISDLNMVSCNYCICDGTQVDAAKYPADGASITLRVAWDLNTLSSCVTTHGARKVMSNWTSDYMRRANAIFEQRCVRQFIDDIYANVTDIQTSIITMKDTLIYQRVVYLRTSDQLYSQITIQIPLTIDIASFNAMLENPCLATRLF